MPRPKANSQTASGTRWNAKDLPLGDYGPMTDQASKFQQSATMAALDDSKIRGWGWNNSVTRWNDRIFEAEPMNYFGVKEIDDTRSETRYAPGGMDGQLHCCASDGSEMRTMPVKKQFNIW